MKAYLVPAILLLAVVASYGQQTTVLQADTQGVSDYCRYVTEQGKAQRDLLRTPSAEVGPIQPSTGTPPQMVFGVTTSVADLWKAHLTTKVADSTCKLYASTTAAQMHILYALPGIEKQVLTHRLDLIQQADDQLDELLVADSKILDAGNLTKPALYTLQGAKLRLDMSRTETLSGLTTPYVPPLSKASLRDLAGTKMVAEGEFQKATVRLEKQNAWDIKLEGGAHRQLSDLTPGQSANGPFGQFSLTYNFGHHAISSHFDKSADAYVQWKTTQFDDVTEQARVLKQQILDTIKIQRDQLNVLVIHDGQINEALKSIEKVDSSAALAFRTQLLADRIVLNVDIQDVQFRIDLLKKFLEANY